MTQDVSQQVLTRVLERVLGLDPTGPWLTDKALASVVDALVLVPHETVNLNAAGTAGSGGNDTLTTTVPANEVWLWYGARARDPTSAITGAQISATLIAGGLAYHILDKRPLAAGEIATVNLGQPIVLQAGAVITVVFLGTTAGDTLTTSGLIKRLSL